ncbi:MAG TPA: hypothetical protein VLH08_02470, partial [Acidobacteriota bacterium]|nr:hypothetical protein [Acidobacteriota bacterium]
MSFLKGILHLNSTWQKMPLRWRVPLVVLTVMGIAAAAWGIITDLTLVAANHQGNAEHVDQMELLQMVQDGESAEAFGEAFEHGDELFETDFNALDGGGANVGQGQRFTRIPRADLTGPGQWANHVPSRATGPNGTACNQCHSQLFDDGSGSTASNVHRDPLHSGVLSKFIQRNTPHVFAAGALQRLAEEMTVQLLAIKEQARVQACSQGQSTKTLTAKGINFGSIKARRTQSNPCAVTFNTGNVQGVASDLIVRPYQWKGNFATLRAFNRDAAHNEIGMQAVEIVGDGVDGDADGVVDEMTVGDQTALAVYLAAQPRPTSSIELAALGLIDPLPSAEVQSITRGAVK